MAIYRLSANIVKRSEGRSVVACAAYRSGEMLHDDRQGQTFDYARRQGVVHTEIMAPADTPAWMRDRSALWNAVEAVERRRDSQLAREIQLALPHEISHEDRLAIVRGFVADQFVDQGMIADVAVHAPDPEGDARNHHAHVLLTMRNLTGDGFGGKCRDWNGTDRLRDWRMAWAEHVNTQLERLGRGERIDHRSLEEQGIDREPEPKQGPVATQMEREGKESHAGRDRRAAKARNDERDGLHREETQLSAEIYDLEEERAGRRRKRDRDSKPEQLRGRWKGQWDALKADQEARRQAIEAELIERRAEKLAELEEKQARRALREEAAAAGPPPEPEDFFGRWQQGISTRWNRFLDLLDRRRIEERQRKEQEAAAERAKARALREAVEREKMLQRQDSYDDRVRDANGWREKSERRDLLRVQDREYARAVEEQRRAREAERAQRQEVGKKPQTPDKSKAPDRGDPDDRDGW